MDPKKAEASFMKRVNTQKLLDWLGLLGVLLVLAMVAAAADAWIRSPWDGMDWLVREWVVLGVADGGPAARAGIRPGDQLLAIDGVPVWERFPMYSGVPGDTVDVTLRRQGATLVVPLTSDRLPGAVLALRLANLAVALLFSVLSFAFCIGERQSRPRIAFVFFYQLLAAVIASGSASGLQISWAVRTFYLCMAFLCPVALFMASSFPLLRNELWIRWLHLGSLVLSLALAAALIVLPLPMLVGQGAGHLAIDLTYLALLTSVALSLALIFQSFRRARDAITKAAIRVSLLGLAISVLPFLVFYLMPRIFIGRGIASAEVTLLFLAILPLYHGFGMTRRRFSGLETVLPPVSAAMINGVWFVAILLGSTWLLRSLWPGGGEMALYGGVVVGAVILAATNVSVISGARRMVHHAFFGQAYDYQSVVSDMSRDLAQAVGRKELGKLVVGTLCQRMSLAGAALLSAHNSEQFVELEASSGSLTSLFDDIALGVDALLVRTLYQDNHPQRREGLSQRLANVPLQAHERDLLEDERIALWAPVIVRGSLRGIIVLGNKLKDALFSYDDLAIVATLVRQIGVSMENADLYDSLRAEMRKLQEMQDQLVQAEKLSAVGELVSGVAHELNNPLTAVIGYAELLRADLTDEQAKKDIDNILRSAERSRRIVRNLLTFARHQKAERKMVDLNELIQQTIEIQAYQLRMDNIQVITDLDPELAHTAADPSQLQQVLLNIIMNAHQAVKSVRNRGTISVSTRMSDASTIRISIKDDGPGIPAEIIGRIFDPFFTTKEVGVGTGLGLSICYGIVIGHGGRIWCESTLGEGATFVIELPVQRLQLAEEGNEARAPETKSGLKVLVVEDEAAVAAVLQRLLAKKGCTVEAASTGLEALQRLRSSQYDVIISDIKMPDMGGIALWENLKTTYPHLATRVIFVTGDTASLETSEFLKEAGQPVLPKPFGAEDLARAIGELQNQA